MKLFFNLCRHPASASILKLLFAAASTRQDAIMASAAAAGVAVKFWTPNLGARVPTNLNMGIPGEYLESGLWCQRRMLRSVSRTGAATYEPQGARAWPESLSTAVLQVYDSRQQTFLWKRRRPALRGALAPRDGFEEANSGRCVLPWCREPGAASSAGADDQRHGWRCLRLAEQLGVKTSESVLRAQAQLEPQLGSAERRAVREPADAAGFQVDAGEDPCVSSE